MDSCLLNVSINPMYRENSLLRLLMKVRSQYIFLKFVVSSPHVLGMHSHSLVIKHCQCVVSPRDLYTMLLYDLKMVLILVIRDIQVGKWGSTYACINILVKYKFWM